MAGSLLAAPWIVYSAVRNRRFEATAAFSLSLVVASGVMSLVTGDPRLLLVRDSWLGALFGIWILAALMTRRPFVMVTSRAMVVAKLGEAGARAWEGRWDREPDFRRHVRILSAICGVVLLADAGVRVVLACSLPIDAVPGVSTTQWLVVLGCLPAFHTWYVNRTGLKAWLPERGSLPDAAPRAIHGGRGVRREAQIRAAARWPGACSSAAWQPSPSRDGPGGGCSACFVA